MYRLSTVCGLDPSLRHGAFIKCIFGYPRVGKAVLLSVEPTYIWKARSKYSLQEKSTVHEVIAFVQNFLSFALTDTFYHLAIDFDERSVHWTRRPVQVLKLYLMLGYLIRGLHELGYNTHYVTPDEVRKTFGLKAKADKAEVWAAFRERVEMNKLVETLCTDEDVRDAVILAYTVSLNRESLYARPTTSALSSDGAQASDAVETAPQTPTAG